MKYQISAHLIPKDYSHRKTSQLFVSGNQSRGQDTATWYASVDSVVSMNLVSSVPYKHCHFNGKCHSFPFLRIPMSTHKLTRSPRHIYTHIHITVVNFSFKILRTPGGSKLLQGMGGWLNWGERLSQHSDCHESMGPPSPLHPCENLGLGVHTYNLSTVETETGRSQGFARQPAQCNQQASVSMINSVPCPKGSMALTPKDDILSSCAQYICTYT